MTLAAHHIALDTWSIGLLFTELASLVSSAGNNLPVNHLQYVDYAAWQRRAVKSNGAALDWWTQKLDGAPPTSMFPPDVSCGQSGKGESFNFAWDAGFSADLRRFSREQGVTVYMVLIAACAALIRAYTGQSDILLGSPMGDREHSEFEDIIGPFVNVLVLRISIGEIRASRSCWLGCAMLFWMLTLVGARHLKPSSNGSSRNVHSIIPRSIKLLSFSIMFLYEPTL